MNNNRIVSLVIFFVFLLITVLVPIAPQNWGDDFSLYLMQAAGYSGDDSYSGLFIHHADVPMYSPSAYPPAFPFLLAPIYFFAGTQLIVYQIFIAVLLVLVAFLIYTISKNAKFPLVFSVLSGLLVCAHSCSLALREEILPDVFFAAGVLLFVLFYNARKQFWLVALIGLIVITTRTAGYILIIALFMDWLAQVIFNRNEKEPSNYTIKIFLSLLLATVLLSFIFPLFYSYVSSFQEFVNLNSFTQNYLTYKMELEYYFMDLFNCTEDVFKWFFWIIVTSFLFGNYLLLKEKNRLPVFLFYLYAIVVLCFPYKWGGYRMLFPLFPFLWWMSLKGISYWISKIKYSNYVHAILSLFIALFLVIEIVDYSNKGISDKNSPESKQAKELFTAIEKNVSQKSIVLSARPRAIALYTQKHGMYMQRESYNADSVMNFIQKNKIEFVVQLKNCPHFTIDKLANDTTLTKLLWRNELYSLHKVNK